MPSVGFHFKVKCVHRSVDLRLNSQLRSGFPDDARSHESCVIRPKRYLQVNEFQRRSQSIRLGSRGTSFWLCDFSTDTETKNAPTKRSDQSVTRNTTFRRLCKFFPVWSNRRLNTQNRPAILPHVRTSRVKAITKNRAEYISTSVRPIVVGGSRRLFSLMLKGRFSLRSRGLV